MLHLSGEPSQTQPKNLEYWSQTLCSPATAETRRILNGTEGEHDYLCVHVFVHALTDEGLSLTGPEESGRDRKEGLESPD